MASLARSSALRSAALAATRAPVASSCLASNRLALAKANVAKVAAFHTTSKRDLLPVGPQRIVGTVNDAVPVPPSDAAHGSYHWTFDRLLAAGLVPLSLAPFVAGTLNPATDAILCGMILVHSHMGFNNIVTDYIPKRTYPKSRATADWALRLATLLVGVGLYEFETNDVGVTEAIKRVWRA